MSDRIAMIHVALEKDVSEEEIKPMLAAIRQLRGVEAVTTAVANVDLWLAQERAAAELRGKIANPLPGKGQGRRVTMPTERIYEGGSCPGPCSVCDPGPHHWLVNSIDPIDTNREELLQWLKDHPQITLTDEALGELLIAHYECKHCPAIREYEPCLEDEDEECEVGT